MKRLLPLAAFVATFGLAACSEPTQQFRGVYMLIDTSGTYTQELEKAQQIINAILTRLEPGDSFAVAPPAFAAFGAFAALAAFASLAAFAILSPLASLSVHPAFSAHSAFASLSAFAALLALSAFASNCSGSLERPRVMRYST